MTSKEFTALYRQIVLENGYTREPERWTNNTGNPQNFEEARGHLLWMLDEMDKMPSWGIHGATEKWHAWRGFIQGCLWMNDYRTIDEMREHSRGLTYR